MHTISEVKNSSVRTWTIILYLDNICRPVLSRAAECLILDKPLTDLRLSNEEKRELQEYFTGMDREKIRDQEHGLHEHVCGFVSDGAALPGGVPVRQ